MSHTLDHINGLFLELSQFATAVTKRELDLMTMRDRLLEEKQELLAQLNAIDEELWPMGKPQFGYSPRPEIVIRALRKLGGRDAYAVVQGQAASSSPDFAAGKSPESIHSLESDGSCGPPPSTTLSSPGPVGLLSGVPHSESPAASSGEATSYNGADAPSHLSLFS